VHKDRSPTEPDGSRPLWRLMGGRKWLEGVVWAVVVVYVSGEVL